MDELRDKLKKSFNIFSKATGSSSKAFQGRAHVLGSAPTQTGVPAGAATAPVARDRRPTITTPQPQQTAAPPAAAAAASGAGSSSHAFAASTQPATAAATAPLPAVPSDNPPPAATAQVPSPSLLGPADSQLDPQTADAIAAAVGQLSSESSGAAAAEVLSKLLGNIVAGPSTPKFRRVRLTNPHIQSAVVDVGGGLELLLGCGFEIVFEDGAAAESGGGASGATAEGQAGERGEVEPAEGYAVLHDAADLAPLSHALRLLAPLRSPAPQLPAPAQQAGPSALPSRPAQQAGSAAPPTRRAQQQREWDPPRARNTQVLLPASVEQDVPDWFFQRTGQELKAAFMSAVRRREHDQVLMTRAMRERLRGPASASPTFATVKVRFPEGISLQGEFGAGEPVAAVFAWVADCLSDPLHTYELVLPSRRPLEPRPQSVREADLLPSVALLFRWTGQSAAEMAHVPALRAELLRAARPATVSY